MKREIVISMLLLFIISLFPSVYSLPSSINSAITHHYSFDGNLIDSAGNNNMVASKFAYSSPQFISTGGLGESLSFGKYLTNGGNTYPFSGTRNAYLQTSDSSGITPGDFAISFWFKAERSFNLSNIFYAMDENSNNIAYIFTFIDNQPIFIFNDDTSAHAIYGAKSLGLGLWYHAVISIGAGDYDGSYARLFINGVEPSVSLEVSENPLPAHKLVLGGGAMPSLRPGRGQIDEMIIFNRALTATEVKALYDSQKGSFSTSVSSPAIYGF